MMNERIEELVEQAIVDVDVVYEDNPLNEELAKMYIPDCFAEKFAELIIQECVSICKDRERSNLYGVREVEVAIKEHFGVNNENER